MRVPVAQGERAVAGQQWNQTHLALALGLAACQRGHRVRFTTAAALVAALPEIADEPGFVPLFYSGEVVPFYSGVGAGGNITGV